MAGKNGRHKRFGRGSRTKAQEAHQAAPHNAAVAAFPEPKPFPDSSVTPAKPVFTEKLTVELSKVEREVTRYALNEYAETLGKLAKQMKRRGLSNVDIMQRIAIINGGDGLGQGLYQKIAEQISIVDPKQIAIEEEERRNEAEAVACTEALMGLTEMPADIAAHREQLLALTKSWTSNQRTAVTEYCVNVGALAEGEKYSGEIPTQVRTAIDRAIEWTMPEADIERFIGMGPYRAAWLEDDAKKVFHYAELIPKDGEPEPTKGDHGLFETEGEARRCVARLNQLASLDVPAPPATDVPVSE